MTYFIQSLQNTIEGLKVDYNKLFGLLSVYNLKIIEFIYPNCKI